MKAPAGAVVALHVDLIARVHVGDIIETESGRRYQVIVVRVQERGKHRGRQHIRCIVLSTEDMPDMPIGSRVHVIRWYSRDSKRRSRDRPKSCFRSGT